MNYCSFIGRITADPEIRTSNSGKKFINFNIAVDRDYKNADGSRKTDFISCIAWDPVASIITRFANKGDKIYISGRYEIDNYTDKDGNNKTFNRILVNQFEYLQGKPEAKAQPAKEPLQAPQKKIAPDPEPEDDYYNLPFPLEGA